MTDANFATRLAGIRKQRGLTQQALADRSGAHVTQIRRCHRGRGQAQGSRVSASTCAGRTTVKSRQFIVATSVSFSRSATATIEASIRSSRRSL